MALKRTCVALLCLIFLSHSGGRAGAEETRVACLGDSITAGARVDADRESYPAQLQAVLGTQYRVKNLGLGSATLLKVGRPNVWSQLDALSKFEPDIVVISLGTNDTVGGRRRNWERIDTFERDYLELIGRISALPSKPHIVVCTPTDMVLSAEGLSAERKANLEERRPRLLELCRRIQNVVRTTESEMVSQLDLNSVLQQHPEWVTQGDGVHPNAEGYRQIARAVADHIGQLEKGWGRQVEKRPNIILFLVDDMGWQDTSVPFHEQLTELNRRFRTPNMEDLAQQGMKFTQAYACSVCSPTRVSLMTGLNAARHRVTNWTLRKNATNDRPHSALEFPEWNVNGLSPEPGIERTVHARALPDFLRELGYRTIHVGKAHFGAVQTPGSDPSQIGFDINIGGHAAGGPGSFLGEQNFSAAWRKGDRIWDVPGLDNYHGQPIFLTEALTREANRAVDDAIDADKPFFLYMAHYAVHVPFAEDPRFYGGYRERGLDHTEAMYAAMVEGMDKSLGDILENVRRQGQTENTVVFFLSDNGGLSAQGRGGQRHSHNRPLSSGKGSAHEGGVRVPMLVSWPGVTEPASVCRQPVIVEDLFPTILEVAGHNSPQQVGGVIDGQSFVPLLHAAARPSAAERPLIWHFPNNWGPKGPGIGASSSIRLGQWKMIYYHEDQTYELFRLSDDISEEHNLLTDHPDVALRLAGVLRETLIDRAAQMPRFKDTGMPVPWPGQTQFVPR